MNDIDFYTCQAMLKYGGLFVKSLAECFHRGDPRNRSKLKVAFSEYFKEYEKIGEEENPKK